MNLLTIMIDLGSINAQRTLVDSNSFSHVQTPPKFPVVTIPRNYCCIKIEFLFILFETPYEFAQLDIKFIGKPKIYQTCPNTHHRKKL